MAKHTDRMVPHDLDAERATLGSMLAKPQTIRDVLRVIPADRPDWFLAKQNAEVFRAIVAMDADRSKPIDLVVMHDWLKANGKLEECGGDEYLIELAESYGDSANAKYYAGIVREKGVLRDLILAADRLRDGAFDPLADSAELLADLDRALNTVGRARKRNEPEGMAAISERIREMLGCEDSDVNRVPCGFETLQRALGGFGPGEVIVVAARPSIGKTGLACAFAMAAAGAGHSVLFESLEMDRLTVATRMACSAAGVDTRLVRDRRLSDVDRLNLDTAIRRISALPIRINDVPGLTLQELRADVRAEAMSGDGIGLVVVDYLGLLKVGGSKRVENRNAEMTILSDGVKQIAGEFRVPVLLLAQLNREAAYTANKGPELHHLRDSGSIEQDADAVLMLWREDDNGVGQGIDMGAVQSAADARLRGETPDLTRIIHAALRKNRNGPVTAFQIQADYRFSQYTEKVAGPSWA